LLVLSGVLQTVPWLAAVAVAWCLGFLILTSLARREDYGTERLLVSLAIGVSVLMLLGLVVNAVSLNVGIPRPLTSSIPSLVTLVVLVTLYLAAIWRLKDKSTIALHRRFIAIPLSRTTLYLGAISVVLPLLSVAAAKSVDIYRTWVYAAAFVIAALFFMVIGWWFGRRENSGLSMAMILAGVPTSLTLLASLRSDFVIGVDVSYELAVATRVGATGYWTPGLLEDPYTVAASLTVLPAWLSSVFGLSAMDFFKVFAPLLFGLTPLAMFHFFRTRFSVDVSFWSSLVPLGSVAFTEIALMGRQGIALFLVAVLLLLWSRPSSMANSVSILVVLAGLILSHYATALVFLSGVTGAFLLMLLRGGKNFETTISGGARPIVVIIGIVAFYLWFAVSTNQFWSNITSVLRTILRTGLIESSSAYTFSYATHTSAGPVGWATQAISSLLRLSIIVGMLSSLLSNRLRMDWMTGFALSLGGIALVVAVVPYLAWQAYTFERLYFQALLVLAPFVFGVPSIARLRRPAFLRLGGNGRPIGNPTSHGPVIALAVGYILLGTSILPVVVSGETSNSVQFDLTGGIYRRFYTYRDEVAAVRYLVEHNASLVFADRYGVLRLTAYGGFVDLQRYRSYNGQSPSAERIASQMYADTAVPSGSYLYLRAENIAYGVWRLGPEDNETQPLEWLLLPLFPRAQLVFDSGQAQVWRFS